MGIVTMAPVLLGQRTASGRTASGRTASGNQYIDPTLGVEQFFDPDGAGPTPLDQQKWDAALSPVDKVKIALGPLQNPGSTLSKIFSDLFKKLTSTLTIIVVSALIVSFVFFYFKKLASKA